SACPRAASAAGGARLVQAVDLVRLTSGAFVKVAAIGVLVGAVVAGARVSMRGAGGGRSTAPARGAAAVVMHDVIARGAARVDLFLPAASAQRAPWIALAVERGSQAEDERARVAIGSAEAMQQRG